MPGTSEILAGLTQIANEAFAVAAAWHGAVALALVAIVLGWRPESRTIAWLLSLPLASVSVLAWVYGNPFNGAVFAVLAAALAWAARSASREVLQLDATGSTALGAALMAFGWVYPHFLVGRPQVAYLYGAPLGTIPCPTLSFVVGAALLSSSLRPRGWQLVLASIAALYALIGVLRLGVAIDLMLLLGAIGLAFVQRAPQRSEAQHTGGRARI
jgi:hypothetical protein